MDKNRVKNALIDIGAPRMAIIAITALICWGVIGLLWRMSGSSSIGIVVVGICAVFGWRYISQIQPSMFIWMPLVGWFIYFFAKFIFAGLLGFFIVPYKLGNYIGRQIADSLNLK